MYYKNNKDSFSFKTADTVQAMSRDLFSKLMVVLGSEQLVNCSDPIKVILTNINNTLVEVNEFPLPVLIEEWSLEPCDII